jgi:antitoxin component YwqK of YwqJK toxin-antitoxin module
VIIPVKIEEYYRSGILYKEENSSKKFPYGYKESTTKWYENGIKELEGTYKDGKKDGKWIIWDENGQKNKEGMFKNGKEDGLHISWYENGIKEEQRTYNEGKKHGLWTKWNELGKRREEIIYKEGVKHGLSTMWFNNGKLKSEVSYDNDIKNGKYKKWNENGEVTTDERYNNGEIDCSYLSKTRMEKDLLSLITTLNEYYNESQQYPEYPFDSFFVTGTKIPDCYLEGYGDKKGGHWVTSGRMIFYGKNNEWIYDYNTGKISKIP